MMMRLLINSVFCQHVQGVNPPRQGARGVQIELALSADTKIFGEQAAGAPFTMYLRGVKNGSATHRVGQVPNNLSMASYAVKAGDVLRDQIVLSRFTSDDFEIEVYGPNGFYHQFIGNRRQPAPTIHAVPAAREKGSEMPRCWCTLPTLRGNR